jgi:putative ABC transport system permease protein
LTPARLGPSDLLRVGSAGLRTRHLRAVLSALGIAIGIASMIAVLGISTSNKAQVNAELDKLGTNLLVVQAGKSLLGQTAKLPVESVDMIARIPQVHSVSATGSTEARVYRTDHIPAAESKGIAVRATRTDLLHTAGATVHSGTWLNTATSRYPAVVLGATAAQRLGVTHAGTDRRVWLGGQWFTVIGILDPVGLVPDLDSTALVGWPVAVARLGFDGHPSTIYERSADDAVAQVRALLPATANPEHPEQVTVSRPSDALAARGAVNTTLTGLLLGLGAVALLVGGIGVANTMIISVLERRTEIGLRRALGATRSQIRGQFLSESLLLSALGATLAAILTIGALAGLYPAIRAARLNPTPP